MTLLGLGVILEVLAFTSKGQTLCRRFLFTSPPRLMANFFKAITSTGSDAKAASIALILILSAFERGVESEMKDGN